MTAEKAKERLDKILTHLETKAGEAEKRRVFKLLDEALDHAELVTKEFDDVRKADAQKKRQEDANRANNEAAKRRADEKATKEKK